MTLKLVEITNFIRKKTIFLLEVGIIIATMKGSKSLFRGGKVMYRKGMERRFWLDSKISRHSGRVKGAFLFSVSALFLIFLFFSGIRQTGAEDCGCSACHAAVSHGPGWNGCSTCHDSPPQTATHLTHYNSAPVKVLVYGDTAISSVDDAYKFGCGNCHPLDNLYHRNGSVEVELYNTAAPADSLKAKNPSNAAYDPTAKTCSNVYCHSGYTVTSGPVGLPLTTADNPALFPPLYKINKGYIMDETCSNVSYAPYTVNYQRVYKTTPAWGTTGTFTTCKECHEFPLTTWEPDVQAMAGDTHQWVTYNAEWGEWWNQGHAYNMGYYGIPCATCHFGTADHWPGSVSNPPTSRPTYGVQVNGAWISGYKTVSLKSRVMHVNGSPDVSFDTTNGYRYYAAGWRNQLVNLLPATYDPATKTCSNVGCHFSQRVVKWGFPNRMNEGLSAEACDVCHRTGYLSPTCTTP
ncbi:MAG: CxxxxCH/CxxCH domain-containing protein [Thermodesulfovibrionales bacterium]